MISSIWSEWRHHSSVASCYIVVLLLLLEVVGALPGPLLVPGRLELFQSWWLDKIFEHASQERRIYLPGSNDKLGINYGEIGMMLVVWKNIRWNPGPLSW